MQGIQDAPFIASPLNLIEGAVHSLDALERLLHLCVVVELADKKVGLCFELVYCAPGHGRGFGGLDDLCGECFGAEDVVLDGLGVRLPCSHIVDRLLVDRVYLCLRMADISNASGRSW